MLEHLLMSVPLRGGKSFAERVEEVGGYTNADTGLEQMHFYARVHADAAADVGQMLVEAIKLPQISRDSLAAERQVVLTELAGAAADPNDLVQDAILGALFPGHPLGNLVGGVAAEVEELILDDVIDHHQHSFIASPMVLATVGPESLATLMPSASAAAPRMVRRCVALPPILRASMRWPDEYAWLCLGARSPALRDPARAAFTVLAELLGPSSASLLYRRLRNETGLAYNFSAWDRGYTEAGAWRLLVGVDRGNSEGVLGVIQKLIKDVATGDIDMDTFRAAKRQAEMRVILAAEDPLELAQTISDHELTEAEGWSATLEAARLRAVTADDVANAAAVVLNGLTMVVRPEREPADL